MLCACRISCLSAALAPRLAHRFSTRVHLQLVEGGSDKFYNLAQGEGEGSATVTTSFGRTGTAGQRTTATHATPAAALAALRKAEAAKRKKGYTDAPPPLLPSAQAAAGGSAPAFPLQLAEGESVVVPSSSSSSSAYRVKCVSTRDGLPNIMSCTCLGFTQRIQARGIEGSTCRHIALALGEEAEASRLARAHQRALDSPPPPDLHSPDIAPLIALAHAWAPRVDPTGMLLSEKLDGMRALWHQGRLWSRQGNALHAPAFFTAALPPDCTLDGELHMGRGRFSECVSVTRTHTGGERWRGVHFAVFDAPLAPGGFAARLEAAGAALAAARGAASEEAFASLLPHTPCAGPQELALALQEMVAAGGEGLMLRAPLALFTGGRTHDLLKVKEFKDEEALVIGYEAGQGRNEARVGALRCRLRSGKEFSCGSGLSDVQREAPPALGSVVTVKFFELSKDGIPRFPVLLRVRGDVSPAEFGSTPRTE